MFASLTKPSLSSASASAKIYLRPAWFVDRPHELDEACLRLADTMLWFAGWQISLREGGAIRSALVPVPELDDWIAAMPVALGEAAMAQRAAVQRPRSALVLGERTVRLNEPQLMGILNVTPDSFSDGGKHVDAAAAAEAGFAMATAGAAIIDVGGESTRPGAPLVWEGDEIARVEGVVAALARGGAAVSIDTRKAAVMEAALAAGAAIVNDISALRYDARAMEVVAGARCPVVLMHAPSAKSDPHEGGGYEHPLFDVYDMLEERIAACLAAGIDAAKIIVPARSKNALQASQTRLRTTIGAGTLYSGNSNTNGAGSPRSTVRFSSQAVGIATAMPTKYIAINTSPLSDTIPPKYVTVGTNAAINSK